MELLIKTLLRVTLRVVLLLMGLVFAASVLFAVLVLFAAWALRALWARLTGRPVNPWVMRVDPRAQWSRFYASAAHSSDAPPKQRQEPSAIGDITDVVPREKP